MTNQVVPVPRGQAQQLRRAAISEQSAANQLKAKRESLAQGLTQGREAGYSLQALAAASGLTVKQVRTRIRQRVEEQ
jgi:hypothetical protein